MMHALQWIRSIIYIVQVTIAMPVIGLAFAPWAMFSKLGAYKACKTYAAWAMWSARWLIGLRCEVRGTVPQGEVLVAAKHQSFLDILMIFHALPRAKFIMKREVLWTPVIGQYAKRMGMIAVNRGKRGQAITQMMADVTEGRREPGQIVIYSQGTRVAPGLSAPYKVGTAVLYDQLGQICVPVATNASKPRRGTRSDRMPSGNWKITAPAIGANKNNAVSLLVKPDRVANTAPMPNKTPAEVPTKNMLTVPVGTVLMSSRSDIGSGVVIGGAEVVESDTGNTAIEIKTDATTNNVTSRALAVTRSAWPIATPPIDTTM